MIKRKITAKVEEYAKIRHDNPTLNKTTALKLAGYSRGETPSRVESSEAFKYLADIERKKSKNIINLTLDMIKDKLEKDNPNITDVVKVLNSTLKVYNAFNQVDMVKDKEIVKGKLRSVFDDLKRQKKEKDKNIKNIPIVLDDDTLDNIDEGIL